MSAHFQTESDLMIQTAARVDDTNSDVQSELHRLRGVVDGLRGSWAGQAQASFDQLMIRWEESATKLNSALAAISENIRANATNFAAMEAENAHSFAAVGGEGLAL